MPTLKLARRTLGYFYVFAIHFVILAIVIIYAKQIGSFSCDYYLKFHSHFHSNT